MISLETEIPDLEVLLSMAPSDLAPFVLRVAYALLEPRDIGRFSPEDLMVGANLSQLGIRASRQPLYRTHRQGDVEQAIDEALQWLEANLLIMPLGGMNRGIAMRRFTRLGREVISSGQFDAFRAAASFPKSLLHPTIAEKVWLSMARGDLDEAVFVSMRAVEVAVRELSGLDGLYGVDLMRQAFNPKGPLASCVQPKSEQEAWSALFAGAMGAFKNPRSHTIVTDDDRRNAQDQVLLASHLLRAVDQRRPV